MREKKPLKVGLQRGGGPPPGYEWSVGILDAAFREAIDFLTPGAYGHVKHQFKDLASQGDPSHSLTVDVRPIEDFYELRDKGGVLGNCNLRVFFGIDRIGRAIIVLGAFHKQNDGPTPLGDKVRIRIRWRNYLKGLYGFLHSKDANSG